jgi:hypothetical protein
VFQKKEIVKKEQKLLKYKGFVIISDNCWRGAVYQWYKNLTAVHLLGWGFMANVILNCFLILTIT